jgi:photosystem II stability/assembly factor-like uncharacterized protein
MRKKYTLAIALHILILLPLFVSAQSGFVWQVPTNAPGTVSVKFDDIHFLNPTYGMTCNGDGKVYRTLDAGVTWDLVLSNPAAFFRSIVIVDSLHAFVGNFGYFAGSNLLDSTAVYQTTDGGATWAPAPIPTPARIGICGLHKVGNQNLHGVGRIEGPTSFIKSTDSGVSWTYTDMAPYCNFLVDCYFHSADTGFVIGGTDSLTNSYPIILKTNDAGASWDTVQIGGPTLGSWCWKINFPSHQVGYVSIESLTGAVHCFKTTDGGDTWSPKAITPNYFSCQGIGFVNDNVGWAGGYYGNNLFETVDGGDSWNAVPSVTNLNRVTKLSDTLLWASGKQLYKVTPTPTTGLTLGHTNSPLQWKIGKCGPSKCVTLEVLQPDLQKNYEVFLYDVAGRLIKSANIDAREKVVFDLNDLSHSIIYFVLTDGENFNSKLYVNN